MNTESKCPKTKDKEHRWQIISTIEMGQSYVGNGSIKFSQDCQVSRIWAVCYKCLEKKLV